MWLSSTSQQAIQAVLHIARAGDERPMRVDEIAATLGYPRNYLSKTMHVLARAGVLRSERGRRGGFRLAVHPSRLPLARVIAPFEPAGDRRCLDGRPSCSDARPCPAHNRWKKIARQVDAFFRTTTIATLLKDTARAAQARDSIASLAPLTQRSSHGSIA
jgi:Rrf2 family protein